MANELIVKNGLKVDTTTGTLLPPVLTTVQRTALVSPPTGSVIYNTTTGGNETYNGSAWKTVIDGSITSPLANQVLTYNGTAWVNQATAVNVSANLFNYYNFI